MGIALFIAGVIAGVFGCYLYDKFKYDEIVIELGYEEVE